MDLFKGNELQNAILEVVGCTPGITVKDLVDTLIKKRKFTFSKQYIYRVVSALEDQSILVRLGKRLQIEHGWISSIHNFSEQVVSKLHDSFLEEAKNLHLKDGEAKIMYADSFYALTKMWVYLEMGVLQMIDSQDLRQFVPHAYWVISDRLMSDTLYQFFTKGDAVQRTLIGNDTYLDRHSISIYQSFETEAKIATDVPFPTNAYCFVVVGDYVFESTLPEKIVSSLNFFFDNIHDIKRFDDEFYFDLLTAKNTCSLQVSRDSIRAKQLTERIDSYFQ